MQTGTSKIIYGCMGLGGGWNNDPICQADIDQANGLIDAALELGITVFDHADIYTLGKAETVFGRVLKARPELRQHITIQTKCGIRFADENGPKRYDFSSNWITQSVEKSLQRLQIEQIDTLLLHRPDALVDLAELARTFEQLQAAGKVNQLGVSNMNRFQIEALNAALNKPIVANQLELSLLKPDLITEGLLFNSDANIPCTGTLEYCNSHKIAVQAWASLGRGKLTGGSPENPNQQQTSELVFQLAKDYQVSPEAIVINWLTSHPHKIQPVLGTTNIGRLRACMEATRFNLSREHWYALLVTSYGAELP